MKLILESEARIRLEMPGEDFEIVSEGASLSPYHLLAGSLASCTALTVASWAEGAAIETIPLTVSVSWEMAESQPKRVTHMDMELRWPGLPDGRVATAERVADLCPIHATLKRGTEISRRIIARAAGP
jgi:uncharacterized OsmC-like protein